MTTVATKKIANFEIRELIGTGGMANIFKAVQLSLDRPVALKVLHRHLTLNDNFVARFEKEAKRAAMLHHENIVSIIDYGCDDGEYFIAMEYIEGQSLKEMMTRIRRLPLEVALLIGREVASGLKYAHANGLVHRDVKPANIMLSTDGRVMITDFGIAKDHQDLSLTDTGQMVGSPAYMSPEQAAGRPIDHRCDIFSLGIVLYEIILGEKPFKGETYQELITNIISSEPPDPTKLRVDVTASIERIIKKAMTKDIERRYQDADEMVADLDSELREFFITSPKKLMSEFLRNPIRTTEKLRAERITKHTEKALYFINAGHGRLADASREFENVLRYDRHNKMAKTYLEKLRSGQQSLGPKNPFRLSFRPFLTPAIITSMVLAIGLLIYVLSHYGSARLQGPLSAETPTVAANADTLAKSAIADVVKTPAPERTSSAPRTNSTTPATGEHDRRPAQRTAEEPTHAVRAATSDRDTYRYPNQDLAHFGWLHVDAVPQGVLFVDFERYGRTGGPPIKLTPGRHLITIEADGHREFRKRIFVEDGKEQHIQAILQPVR